MNKKKNKPTKQIQTNEKNEIGYALEKINESLVELNKHLSKTTSRSKRNIEIIKDFALIFIAMVTIFIAIKQNNISEQSMKISNRPYLLVGNLIFRQDKGRFDLSVRNMGSSPSFNTKFFYSTVISNDQYVPSFVHQDSLIKYPIISPSNNASKKPTNIKFPVNNDTLAMIDEKKLFFYCSGEVIYDDIFEDTHIYRFCFRTYNTSLKNFEKYGNYNYEVD